MMHGKTDQEIDLIVQRLHGISFEKTDEGSSDQFTQPLQTHRIDQSNLEENRVAKMSLSELANDIYFHRDLLITSVEGRNIDLVTISSFHGIQSKTEDRLTNLFPNVCKRRSNVFKDKKVNQKFRLTGRHLDMIDITFQIIFISSRVHPGETPASFVLNGFFKLILDKRSVVAATLRFE